MNIIDTVYEELKKSGFKISTAESCTSGYISNLLTSKSGSSAFFEGGIVVYSNDTKINVLGVDSNLIDLYTEVSEQVALDMAIKSKEMMNTDIAIATTGYADVDGYGTEENPPGTIFIAISTPWGNEVKKLKLKESRSRNTYLACLESLEMLLKNLKIHQALEL